jgi:hypothetical protein
VISWRLAGRSLGCIPIRRLRRLQIPTTSATRPPYLPLSDYYADQTQAGRSGYLLHQRLAITLSTALNLNARLGFYGPDDKTDVNEYPVAKFRIAECSLVKDYDWTSPPDATHQYYRRSKIVRADIARVMAGGGSGGLITL